MLLNENNFCLNNGEKYLETQTKKKKTFNGYSNDQSPIGGNSQKLKGARKGTFSNNF